MDHPIKRDHARFRKIVKGRIRDNLRKYVSKGEMPSPKGDGTFKIPMPSIDSPRFKFGDRNQGGMGQGSGEEGDPVDGEQGDGPGEGKEVGNSPGKKELEVELSLAELAAILGEELALPNIEPKGKKAIQSVTNKYTSIGMTGPNSLKHFKRTYKEAMKRQIATGTYDYFDPRIIPVKKDFRYRASNAKVEFDEETFFKTRESGGTLISSALKLCQEIIDADYDPNEWNIYPFHFSDGDNWSAEDTKTCLELLDTKILPSSNVFCYGQVESRYGSGQFYKDLAGKYGEDAEKVILSKIKNKDGILDSIKDFLGKGK